MTYIPANPGYYALLIENNEAAQSLFYIVGWRIEDGYQPEPVGTLAGYIYYEYDGDNNEGADYAAMHKIGEKDNTAIYFAADYGLHGGKPDEGREQEAIINPLKKPGTQLRVLKTSGNAGLMEELAEISAELLSVL